MDELAQRIDAALRQEDGDARWEVVVALAYEGGPTIWPEIERLLASDEPAEQELAFDIAGAVPRFSDSDRKFWGDHPQMQAALSVAALAPEHRRALDRAATETLANATNADLLQSTIITIGRYELAEARPGIAAHVAHADADVREAIAYTLGSVDPGPPQWEVDVLAALARDADDDVRHWAVFSLGSVEPVDTPVTRTVFRENLGHPHDGVAWEAMSALALLGDVEQLLEMFEYENVDADFVEKATEVGDPRLHEALIELRDDGWAADDDAEMAAYREDLLGKALAATS